MRVPEPRRPLAAGPACPLRVVAAGGGTGLPAVLSGLAAVDGAAGPMDVTALVSVSDDGGSSGELRRHYRVPAPGDARNCLVALSPHDNPLAPLFQRRLEGGDDVRGHAVGNLLLTALTRHLGDFGEAVEAAARLLGAEGRVLPAVRGEATLVASLEDGREVRGEVSVRAARGRIASVRLEPAAPAPAAALAALQRADLVVMGPGSLYSSVLASLLGEGMVEALRRTRAVRVWVANLMTEPGETDGYSAADHLAAIQRHLGAVVDVALLHAHPLPSGVVEREAARGRRPVDAPAGELEALGVRVLRRDVAGGSHPPDAAVHDPVKLARALRPLARPWGA